MADLAYQVASLALLFILFIRGLTNRVAGHYPFFFSYLAYVSISGIGMFCIYHYAPTLYLQCYWYNQYIGMALGFGIIWEAYGLIFRNFPGSARMARFLVTFSLAVIFMSSVFFITFWQPTNIGWLIEVERVTRIVQTILLLLSWTLIAYYEIPLGPNVSGIVFGYGFYVSASILILSIKSSVSPEYFGIWRYAQPLAYLFAKLTWLYALWSYHPAPTAELARADELAYPFRSRDTRLALAKMKGSLGRALES